MVVTSTSALLHNNALNLTPLKW